MSCGYSIVAFYHSYLKLYWEGSERECSRLTCVVCDNWHITGNNWHITGNNWYITGNNWHITENNCYITVNNWHITGNNWHITGNNCHITGYVTAIGGMDRSEEVPCSMLAIEVSKLSTCAQGVRHTWGK